MSFHQTPLRYPGGKQRLAPFIAELLAANGLIDGDYVEPYAGGAGVAVELLLGGKVSRIHLNDSSVAVAALWRAVIEQTDDLCALIASATMSVDEWKRHREIVHDPAGKDDLEVGFSTLYLNRCNRSGVLLGGLIGGLAQAGDWKMDVRFPKSELIRRIEAIAERRDKVRIHNWDAEKYIQEYVPTLPPSTLVYCDPPYFANASRLYLNRYKPEDHLRLATVIQKRVLHQWVVSYDGADEILGYYQGRRKFLYQLQYHASRAYKGQEVFIFSDNLAIPPRSTLPYVDAALIANAAALQQRPAGGEELGGAQV